MNEVTEEVVAHLRQELAIMKAEVVSKDERITRLEGSVETRDKDNKVLRDNLKESNARINELEALVPPDGSVILVGDDANDYGLYRDLGAPTEVSDRLERSAVLEEEASRLKRRELLRDVAQAHNWKLSVLERETEGIEVKILGDGDARRFMIPRDGKAAQPIEEWMTENRGDYLPALKLGGKERIMTGSGKTLPASGGANNSVALKRKQASF